MEKKFLLDGEKLPDVAELNRALVLQSDNLFMCVKEEMGPDAVLDLAMGPDAMPNGIFRIPYSFNWTEHLLAREADVLGMHLFSHLTIPSDPIHPLRSNMF